MPRGGKRPGAGAPRGNVNALRHGLHSQQFRQLVQQLAAIPEMRLFLARFAELHARQPARLGKEAAASVAVAAWLRRFSSQGGLPLPPADRPDPLPPLPPLSKEGVRLLARRLVGETIKQGLVRHTREPQKWDSET